jgi:hypothetical protein
MLHFLAYDCLKQSRRENSLVSDFGRAISTCIELRITLRAEVCRRRIGKDLMSSDLNVI